MHSIITHTKDENGVVSIYINKKLHLKFNKNDIVGLYSYISESNYFYIQITLNTMTCTMLCEYTHRQTWGEVLNILDKL